MDKYQESAKRDKERYDLTNTLNRGRREIDINIHELNGWADRIMRSILAPLGYGAEQYWPKNNSHGGAQYKAEK